MTLRVSVVLPVLDGARWLDAALNSVAALAPAPVQVVVVDDGSTDGSQAIAERHAFVTCVDGPRQGIARSYQAGIDACTGDAVAFLGQDDEFVPGGLAALAEALESDPCAGLACGEVQLFTDEVVRFSGLREDRLDRPYRARVPEATLTRIAPLRRVGLDLGSDSAWDIDLFLRLDEAGVRTTWVDALVARKRLRPDSVIHSADDQGAQLVAALRRSIVRRRAGGPV